MKDTRQTILKQATRIFAQSGYEGLSMRTLAEKSGIAQSVIYHYFKDKDILLKEMFDELNRELGQKRANLPKTSTTADMLRQRIEFQLDNSECIVAVLKYYITFRNQFKKFKTGYVPPKSSLHIEEVLQRGLESGDLAVQDVEADAKVITHAINGFLLEFYPKHPKGQERDELVETIHSFLMRALTPSVSKSNRSETKKKGGEKNE